MALDHPSISRRGFTLIELLIALTLAAVICSAAFMAVRVTGQCVATVNRLSTSNRLLHVGISAALDDLDFWNSYDDPLRGDTPLRTIVSGMEGAAFAPLAFTGAEDRSVPASSLDTYFDQSDRKVWYRGDGSYAYPQATGDYPAIARLKHPKSVADPANEAWREWTHRLIATTVNYGYYAYLDYCPANLIHVLYGEDKNVVEEFSSGGGGACHLYSLNWGGGGSVPYDFYDLTYGTAFCLTRNPKYTEQLGNVGRHHFMWWSAGAAIETDYSIFDFCRDGGQNLNLMPTKPDHWPGLEVVTKHFIVEGRSYHTGTVTLNDPITGVGMKLFVTNTGTTLRGARRQRGLDTYLGAAP